MWLMERLRLARDGLRLLDRKRQLLHREAERLTALARERRRALAEADARSQLWSLRAAILGGSGEMLLAAGALAGTATVKVLLRNTMGVVHPEEAHCLFPEVACSQAAATNAALPLAVETLGKTLACAVDVAIAETARARVVAELAATQRRLRAIEHHRLPSLERQRADLEFRLDESEREERVATRWAQLHGAVRR